MERVPTMPVTNSDSTGPSETEDEELTRDQGVENVRPEESSLRPVDHHTISDNNHQGHQQQYQPEQIVNQVGLRSQDTSTNSNLSIPEADAVTGQKSSAGFLLGSFVVQVCLVFASSSPYLVRWDCFSREVDSCDFITFPRITTHENIPKFRGLARKGKDLITLATTHVHPLSPPALLPYH